MRLGRLCLSASTVSSWARKPIHRILVYTEHGITPEVVDEFFSSCDGDVYDPFVGSGTVGVEALLRGRRFVGVDANPAAVVTAAAKLSPETPVRLRPMVDRLARYYSDGVLDKLLDLASRVSTALEAGVFFAVARRFSRLRYSPAPRFGKRRVPDADPVEVFEAGLAEARRDLELLGGRRGEVLLGDSTAWVPRRIECLLTSPPFANNVDYARHTQVELLWLGVPPSRARDLQVPACEAAARRWKRSLAVGFPIGGSRAAGYRRFLGQYLYYMRRHLELVAGALVGEAWYTIGDSVLGGAYIPVHELLAGFAGEFGLRVEVRGVGRRARPGRSLYLVRIVSRR